MSEFKNLKIDDVFVFYFNSGYVNSTAKDEYTVTEITGVENQEELEKLNGKEITKCLQECYDTFLSNQDTGYYKKEDY